LTSANFWPSVPSTTSARAVRRDCTPYDGARRVECTCGSAEWTFANTPPASFSSISSPDAYWPADAPTCQVASSIAAPALIWAALAPVGMASRAVSAASNHQ
jgi:hypothetical protein